MRLYWQPKKAELNFFISQFHQRESDICFASCSAVYFSEIHLLTVQSRANCIAVEHTINFKAVSSLLRVHNIYILYWEPSIDIIITLELPFFAICLLSTNHCIFSVTKRYRSDVCDLLSHSSFALTWWRRWRRLQRTMYNVQCTYSCAVHCRANCIDVQHTINFKAVSSLLRVHYIFILYWQPTIDIIIIFEFWVICIIINQPLHYCIFVSAANCQHLFIFYIWHFKFDIQHSTFSFRHSISINQQLVTSIALILLKRL